MGLWSLTSAEVQGSGHKKKNIPCQDKTCCLERNKVRVVALADGAGSAQLSHFGAEEVTSRIADYFDELYAKDDGGIQEIIASELRDTLTTLATRLECSVKDLSVHAACRSRQEAALSCIAYWRWRYRLLLARQACNSVGAR